MKNNSFVFNLFFLILVNILIKPIYIFGIDRVVQNRVGVEDYGTYASLLNISFILSMMLDFGLTNYNNRRVAQNHEEINHTFLNVLIIKIVFSTAYLAVLSLVLLLFGFTSWKFKLGIGVGCIQIILSMILFLRSNVSGLQMFKTDAVFSASDKFFTILIAGIFLYVLHTKFTIENFVNAQLIGLSAAFVLIFIFVFMQISHAEIAINFAQIKRIIRGTIPFALLFLLMSVYNRIDIILLERLLKDNGAEAGIYAATFRIIDGLQQFAYLFAAILLPVFSKLIATKEDLNAIFKQGFNLIFLMAFSAVILLFIYRNELVKLLYVQSESYWIQVFGVLIFVFIPICVVYLYGSLLTANGNIRELIYISIVGIITMLVLSLFLLQSYKAFGIAISALFTQTVIAVLHIILTHNYFRLHFSFHQIVKYFGFIVIAFVLTYFIHGLGLYFAISIATSAFSIIITAFLLKVITIKDLLQSSSLLKK